MSASKTSANNKEFIKLANKIEKLTKIVDNLQEEVKTMKRNKSYRNENQHREINKGKTLTKSEIIENKSKTNPFERLRFFRKNDKTSEKSDTYMDSNKRKDKDTSKDKARNDQQLGTIKKNDTTDLRITPQKKRSHLTHLNPDDNDERNNNQSGLVCSVKDCSVQTNNDNQESLTQRKISKHKKEKSSEQLDKKVESKSKSQLKSSCDGCAKSSNSKSPQCSKNCPYLDKKQAIDNGTKMEQNNKSKFKEDKIESDQTLKNQDYISDNQHNIKKFKNKKIMVNLIRGSNKESLNNFRNDENLQINCRFIEDVDLSNIRNLKRKSTDTGSARATQKSKDKNNGCKQCSQNCGPKTVLKINKAILAPDPPMIFLSSKESRKGESRHCKKSLIKNCEQFLKRRKPKQCHLDYEPRTCCSPQHEDFSETFN